MQKKKVVLQSKWFILKLQICFHIWFGLSNMLRLNYMLFSINTLKVL